jgi:hypothetical protein
MDPLSLAIQGGIGIASGIIGSKRRREEQQAAQLEFDRTKAAFQSQDLSNPYMNMQNTMEDLTVNQQAANFQMQQQNQGLANVMNQMQGAAGGSGIAALAQSLANQQSQNAQSASADIARQEAGNQAAAARMAGNLQMAEIQGEEASRALQREQAATEFGLAGERKGLADLARQQATQQLMGGIGNIAYAGIATTPGYAAQVGSGSRIGNLLTPGE